MNKRYAVYIAIIVGIIILGTFIATIPHERLLYNKEYSPVEYYPSYNYVNLTVDDSDMNAEISFDIDRSGNYTDCITIWVLYQLSPNQFEEDFNVTEVNDLMSGGWDLDDFGGFWAGWFAGNTFSPFWEPVPAGDYVFVFWLRPDGSTTNGSVSLTLSLRTSILPL